MTYDAKIGSNALEDLHRLAKQVPDEVFDAFLRAVGDLQHDPYHSHTYSPTGDLQDRLVRFEATGVISYYVQERTHTVMIFQIDWNG